MNFKQALKMMLESPFTTAMIRYRKWSDELVKQEKEDNIPSRDRSYVDKKTVFDRWVKEQKITKKVAAEVAEAMDFKK